MTPAERVIEMCGGPKKVSEVLNINVSNVHRWKYEGAKGGQDGLVPSHYAQKLMDWAPSAGISLTPEDFFNAEAVEGVVQ